MQHFDAFPYIHIDSTNKYIYIYMPVLCPEMLIRLISNIW